jgi:molybdopterin synthase sulfur carrier subunit
MKVKVKTFGITRDMLGDREVEIVADGNSVADLRRHLLTRYPALVGLRSLFIAVNQNYADESLLLHEHDEIALIPPVSGG